MVSLNTVELPPESGGTKLTFTEHAIFLNGFDDPNAEGRRTGSISLINQLEAALGQG